jgi:hypothetical protein
LLGQLAAANAFKGLARYAAASPIVFRRVKGLIFISLTFMKLISFTLCKERKYVNELLDNHQMK